MLSLFIVLFTVLVCVFKVWFGVSGLFSSELCHFVSLVW